MSVKSDSLKELQLSLARWENPSAWEHINQDEPLDPVGGKWVPTVAVVTTPSDGRITIPASTVFTSDMGTILVNLTTKIAEIARSLDVDVLRSLGGLATLSMGTSVFGQSGMPETALHGANRPDPVRTTESLPYARNRKEERILKSIGKKLTQLITRAEAKHGPRDQAVSREEWNAEFWRMVTTSNDRPDHDRRKTR